MKTSHALHHPATPHWGRRAVIVVSIAQPHPPSLVTSLRYAWPLILYIIGRPLWVMSPIHTLLQPTALHCIEDVRISSRCITRRPGAHPRSPGISRPYSRKRHDWIGELANGLVRCTTRRPHPGVAGHLFVALIY